MAGGTERRFPAARTIGVLSDTHGLLRPQVRDALAGADLILHAGDVGDPAVLEELRLIGPVAAVRGNVDRGPWADQLPETRVVEAGHLSIYILHDVHALDLDPVAARFAAVVSGHSHQPALSERSGVLMLNPGAAGPRRFRLPVSVARIEIQGERLVARLLRLQV